MIWFLLISLKRGKQKKQGNSSKNQFREMEPMKVPSMIETKVTSSLKGSVLDLIQKDWELGNFNPAKRRNYSPSLTTVTFPVVVFVPTVFCAVSMTVYVTAVVPVLLNWCEIVAPVPVVPSPKSQIRVGDVPVEVLVNATVSGAIPLDMTGVKLDTGAIGAGGGAGCLYQ
jgi:hypothetical protein